MNETSKPRHNGAVWRRSRDRKHRLRRCAAVAMTLLATTTVLSAADASTANAGSGPIFTVMNTSQTPPDGGWLRNSPHTADTDRVTGTVSI